MACPSNAGRQQLTWDTLRGASNIALTMMRNRLKSQVDQAKAAGSDELPRLVADVVAIEQELRERRD